MENETVSTGEFNKTPLSDCQRMLQFFQCIGQIKREKRTGWTHYNINHVESVSDHMYMMAMMALVLDDKDINKTHCLKMALVHDLAECIVGDITPHCGISKEEKHQKEKDAMLHITRLLPNTKVADEIMNLWTEYGEQETKEAKLVKDLDRYEMILQAYQYEQEEQREGELQSFFNSTAGKFDHPTVKSWADELASKRNATT